ncbi:hypothetical protein BDV59DRAFT_204220 [Aspergillus ambiguus]|uniref:uncharacterized protein n=1 Tax=Aspergillus ambiguus TaxID=176160 RepID=UPI003CCCD474
MGITWNDQADARLLVGIVTTTPAKLDFKALAEFMGPECTVSAIQHRIQRLREKAKAHEPGKSNSASSALATPEASPGKRGRGYPPKNPAASPPKEKKAKIEEDNREHEA